MNQKKCFKCGAVKPIEEFYRHPQMHDGHVNKCKECNKRDVRQNRSKNAEYYRDYDRARANNPDRVSARKNYAQTEPGKESQRRSHNRWKSRNPIKRAANVILGNALRDGRIVRPNACQNCESVSRLHGHHDDYAKPLEVRWLCPQCHNDWHKENGEGANGN